MTTKTVETYESLLNNLVTQQVLFLKSEEAFFDVEITEAELGSSSNVAGLLKNLRVPSYYVNLLLVKAISSIAEQYIHESYHEAHTGFFGSKRRHTDLMREIKIIDTLLPDMRNAKTIGEMEAILAAAIIGLKDNLVKGVLADRCKSHGNYANVCRAIAKFTSVEPDWDFPKTFIEKLGLEDFAPHSVFESSTDTLGVRPS